MEVIAIVLGIIWLLATEHTILFWLIVVPLVIILIISFVKWLKK